MSFVDNISSCFHFTIYFLLAVDAIASPRSFDVLRWWIEKVAGNIHSVPTIT